ncbi:MAG: NfeD family protein [Propionicimonas sp.]|nr:NfeD family protein [Propionicimonas sp.]
MEFLFVVGFVAVVFGVITLLTDGLFDLPDLEWVSSTGLAAGVAMFAFLSGILVGFGIPLGIAAVPGVLAGVGVVAGTSWLLYRLRNSTTGPDTSAAAVVGATGIVITSILPDRLGEVDVVVNGEKQRLSAVSDEEIAAQQPIRVEAVVSPTCVRVVNLR